MRGPGRGPARHACAQRRGRSSRRDGPPPAGTRRRLRLRWRRARGARPDPHLLQRGVRRPGPGPGGRGAAAVRGAAGRVGAGAARDDRNTAGRPPIRRPRRPGVGPCGVRARTPGAKDPAGRARHRGGGRRLPGASRGAAGVRAPGPVRLGSGLRGPRPEVAALDRECQLAGHVRAFRAERDVPVDRPGRGAGAGVPHGPALWGLGGRGVARDLGRRAGRRRPDRQPGRSGQSQATGALPYQPQEPGPPLPGPTIRDVIQPP
jgi:hypothetical protein